jgi:hypothetical protein
MEVSKVIKLFGSYFSFCEFYSDKAISLLFVSKASVARKLIKMSPNFWTKWPKMSKYPHLSLIESPKHLHQTTFETLKYLQQTMHGNCLFR